MRFQKGVCPIVQGFEKTTILHPLDFLASFPEGVVGVDNNAPKIMKSSTQFYNAYTIKIPIIISLLSWLVKPN